jgi:hypothetical protein
VRTFVVTKKRDKGLHEVSGVFASECKTGEPKELVGTVADAVKHMRCEYAAGTTAVVKVYELRYPTEHVEVGQSLPSSSLVDVKSVLLAEAYTAVQREEEERRKREQADSGIE